MFGVKTFVVHGMQITGPVQVARRSDVDMNQHLNNVTYLAWCLETVPLQIYTDCQLYQVLLAPPWSAITYVNVDRTEWCWIQDRLHKLPALECFDE